MPKCPLMWHLNGQNFCWKMPAQLSAGSLMINKASRPSLPHCLTRHQPIYGLIRSSWMIAVYCVTVWQGVASNAMRPACHLGGSDWPNAPVPTNCRNGKKASSIFRMKARKLPPCCAMPGQECRWLMSALVLVVNRWSWPRVCRIRGGFWPLIAVPNGWNEAANVCGVQASIMLNVKRLMINGVRENGVPNLIAW